MARRYYFLALVALLLIPVVVILGSRLAIAIDPESARGHANYARDFRLLALAKSVLFRGRLCLLAAYG